MLPKVLAKDTASALLVIVFMLLIGATITASFGKACLTETQIAQVKISAFLEQNEHVIATLSNTTQLAEFWEEAEVWHGLVE